MRSLAALVAAFALTRVAISLSGSLTQMTDFQSTVSDVSMWTYIPANLPTDEEQAIVVAIHSCERSAQYYYDNTGYAALADQEGYMVIYPNKSTSNGCWDTDTTASLSRDGGGDSNVIVDMVTYAAENLNGNKTNVAVTGSSSGAVMVQVLAGLYPDYFQAASVYSGVYQETIDEGYTGTRPKMMIYHGTADETYAYSNLAEELDGWSAILDVTFTDNTSFVIPDYTEMVYGDGLKLVGISAAGVGHTVPVNAVEDMVWFCISPKCGSDGLPITSSTSSISLATSTTASGSSPTNTDGATTTVDSSAANAPTGTTGTGETSESTSAAASTGGGSSTKLSSGAAAGIGIAGALAIGLLAVGAFCLRKRHQKSGVDGAEHKMMPLDPDGHEYHSGYGMVPGGGKAQPASDGREKFRQAGFSDRPEPQGNFGLGMDPHSPTFAAGGLPAFPNEARRGSAASSLLPPGSVFGDNNRASMASSLLPPGSIFGDNNRASTASSLLPPGSVFGDQQRYSTASSTMMQPHSPTREDERASSPHDKLLPRLPHADDREEQDISDISTRRNL